MSVCFFVPNDQPSTSQTEDDNEQDGGSDGKEQTMGAGETLRMFWREVSEDIANVKMEDFKSQTLPLARIKKIMKLDEDVKMIAAEAPVLFAKAAEIFIHELTLRAWSHTEENKRRTLQRNDIAMAISKSDEFDFLIDIVPRQEVKITKTHHVSHKDEASERQETNNTEQVQYYFQLAQQHQNALHSPTTGTPIQILQPYTQLVQQNTSTASGNSQQSQHSIIQQVITPSGEVQQIQVPAQQHLNVIRMNNSGQAVLLAPTQQIIQVTPQQQQMFLTAAQPATTSQPNV